MRNKASHLCAVTVITALTFLVSAPLHAVGQSPGQSSPAANVVRGDVLNIEGDTYSIKDVTGHEVQLKVNGQTQLEDRIKVGDKIEAQVDSNGHAVTIRIAFPK